MTPRVNLGISSENSFRRAPQTMKSGSQFMQKDIIKIPQVAPQNLRVRKSSSSIPNAHP